MFEKRSPAAAAGDDWNEGARVMRQGRKKVEKCIVLVIIVGLQAQ